LRKLARRDLPALKVLLARSAAKVRKETLGARETPDPKVCKEIPERRDLQVHPVR
jgi:hypothetical protein